jgi:drug/metabolite transporter (DMT)-like permease
VHRNSLPDAAVVGRCEYGDSVTTRAWGLFAALCVVWGIPYLLIRVAVRDFDPATLVFCRTALGAAVLVPLALRRGGYAAVLRRWPALVAFSVVEVALPWVLLSDAERKLSSSLSGLLVAAVPIVGVVIAFVTRSADRGGGPLRYVGLLSGIAGVALLVGIDSGHVRLLPMLEMLVVVVGYAVGPVIQARRLADLPSIPVVSASLLLVAVGYLPYAALHAPAHVSAKALWSVLALGSVCTALAFVLFFALIAAIGPSRSTVITYVNPAVAVLLGVLLLGEKLTLGMVVGFPLILAGSVLAARGKRTARAPAPAEALALSPASPVRSGS